MKSSFRILAIGLISTVCLNATYTYAQKVKAPAPETLKLTTRDGVNLNCVFFAATKGKESVPVIILHDWKQAGSPYLPLAKALQTNGCAVMVPDLRGHGNSKTRRTNVPGETREIDIERMNKRDMGQMYLDVEACKKHLMEQNNAGKLNIERLCIIGNGFGSLLALNYAAYDWNATQLPNYKMGQDVNGLILVSPINSMKGYTAATALKHPVVRSRISMQLIAPSNVQKAVVEAKRLHTKLERFRGPLPESVEERIKKQNLFLVNADIHTGGVGIANRRNLNAWKAIGQFIKLRMIDPPFEWQKRKNPLVD